MDAWVPLFQTLAWIAFVTGLLIASRKAIPPILESIKERVAAGDSFDVSGPAGIRITLGERYRDLRRVEPSEQLGPADDAEAGNEAADPASWTATKKSLRVESRNVYLAHVIGPAEDRPAGWFEVFVFLVGHRREDYGLPTDLSDVLTAEFYLGGSWRHRIFSVPRRAGERTGLRTAFYHPVLCVCRVTFTDGHTVVLNRYLDTEMAALIPDPRRG